MTDKVPMLGRRDLSTVLTLLDYPIAEATLRTLATRGGGPPYKLFGNKAVYDLDDALAWAKSRVQQPQTRGARKAEA